MTAGSVASFLRAGVGFGGSCLPNQVSMTIRTAAQAGVDTPLLTAVDEVNHRRRSQVVERAASLLDGTVRGRRVALLGLTFKPDTDDLRDAPALTIASELIEQGATVIAYDPMPSARERSADLVPGLEVVSAAADAMRDADIAVLVTEWPEFVDFDWAIAAETMQRRVLIDGRNVLNGERAGGPRLHLHIVRPRNRRTGRRRGGYRGSDRFADVPAVGSWMTPERRHHLVVALIAALAGAGIGLEIARVGIDHLPEPRVVAWRAWHPRVGARPADGTSGARRSRSPPRLAPAGPSSGVSSDAPDGARAR